MILQSELYDICFLLVYYHIYLYVKHEARNSVVAIVLSSAFPWYCSMLLYNVVLSFESMDENPQ